MSYKVAIRKNSTGEVRIYDMECEWDADGSMFSWTEGNYGCDCNRELFFERANGIEIHTEWCSVRRFSVLYAQLPNGEKLPIDP